MPNLTGIGSGAGAGAAIGSFIPGVGTGIGAGVGALVGAFRGGNNSNRPATPGGNTSGSSSISQTIKTLVDRAQRRPSGQPQIDEGGDALAQFTQYFRDILGPDPNAALAATAADRGRVIDQYDTARQAAAEFGPRGSGGATAASALSRVSEANQLSDITSNARSNAAAQGGNLAASLAQLGISEEMLASGDFQTIIQAMLGSEQLREASAGRRSQMTAGLAQGVGTLLGLYLTRQQGQGA